MATDFDDLRLAPIYAIHGVAATLTPRFKPAAVITVLDKTTGIEVEDRVGVFTVKPAARVRASEIDAKGLTRADLRGAALTFNGSEWRVEATPLKPGQGGEATGEITLILTEAEWRTPPS